MPIVKYVSLCSEACQFRNCLCFSPIFEGSTEGSGEESRCHPSHLISKHHVTTTELCPGTTSDNHMHHEIDIADYVAPEPDEKTEALLSMSIMINPHDPFDQAEIDEVLSSLERPLEEYRNYYRINAPLPHMITSFVLLGKRSWDLILIYLTIMYPVIKGFFESETT